MLNRLPTHDDLIRELQAFCREELGLRPHRVRLNLDGDTALILLEHALSPTEIEKAQAGEGAEKSYEDQLRDRLKPHLRSMVEAATGQKVAHAHLYIDFPTGNIIGVFVFV